MRQAPSELRLSANVKALLRRMLAKDPAQRITLAECREHPWFKDVDWARCLQRRLAPPARPDPALQASEDMLTAKSRHKWERSPSSKKLNWDRRVSMSVEGDEDELGGGGGAGAELQLPGTIAEEGDGGGGGALSEMAAAVAAVEHEESVAGTLEESELFVTAPVPPAPRPAPGNDFNALEPMTPGILAPPSPEGAERAEGDSGEP